MTDYDIRPATAEDCDNVFQLIKELYDFQNMGDQMLLTAQKVREDGFGERPLFGIKVAVTKDDSGPGYIEGARAATACYDAFPHVVKQSSGEKLQEPGEERFIGYVLYFPIYSTFQGRVLFLEDIYVRPDFRGQGIGDSLWWHVAKEAVDTGCMRLDLQALGWNKKAIGFYEKRGATNLTETENRCALTVPKDQLIDIVNNRQNGVEQ